MKTEINDENKAKFFALYMGNELVVPKPPDWNAFIFFQNERGLLLYGIMNRSIIVNRIAEQMQDTFNQTVLLLKPFSQLTNEHALEIGFGDHKELPAQDIARDVVSVQGFNYLYQRDIDYLRLKGYILPWMGLSIKKMLNAGWVQLEKNENQL